jgi:hypothetical protein
MTTVTDAIEAAGWSHGDVTDEAAWFFRDYEGDREEAAYLRSAERFTENLEKRFPGFVTSFNADTDTYVEGKGSVYIDVRPVGNSR